MEYNNAVQNKINAYWDVRSASYDASPGHVFLNDEERGAWRSQLQTFLPLERARVLDVGTGTGFLAILAAELGHEVTGIDLSPEMLNTAARKAEGVQNAPAFQIGDAVVPPFGPGSFDVILSRHVLWTLRDPASAFVNWRTLLQPGGRIVAFDGLWFRPNQDEKRHPERNPAADAWNRFYSEETKSKLPLMSMESFQPVLELLRMNGFSRCSISPCGAILESEKEEEAPRYVIVGELPGAEALVHHPD